jgi:hypothetical protein
MKNIEVIKNEEFFKNLLEKVISGNEDLHIEYADETQKL